MYNSAKIIELIDGGRQCVQRNINTVAAFYREVSGRDVVRSCPSSVNYMILWLKNYLEMTNFKFTADRAQYKIRRSDNYTISNSNLTDAKAIDFLRENPERIRLFSVYPEDWERLIYEDAATATANDEARLAALAELQAVEDAKAAAATAAATASEEANLDDLTLAELRELYPHITARSKVEFLDELAESKKQK